MFEGIDIVLFVENKHRLLVIDGIHRAETQRAIAVGYQYGIAGNTCCALIAVGKGLDIRQQHQRQKCFLEDVFFAVDEVAGVAQGLTYLELIIQRMVIGAGDADSTVAYASVNRKLLGEQLVDILNVADR